MMMRVCSRFAFVLRRGGAYLPAPSSSLSILHLGRRSFSEVPTMLMNEVPTMGPEHEKQKQPPNDSEDRGSHSVEQALSVIASRGGSPETLTHYIKVFSKRGRVDKIQKLMDSVTVSNGSPSGALNHYHFNAAMASYVVFRICHVGLRGIGTLGRCTGFV